MTKLNVFFAGGGTGGHIYPALAVASQLEIQSPDSKVEFFCSSRPIDSHVLAPTGYSFTQLPAIGLQKSPMGMLRFAKAFVKSVKIAKRILRASSPAAVVGVGGFVSAPVVYAAKRLSIPVAFINVDIVPGKSNRFMARFARKVFVQFEDTASFFDPKKQQVIVSGCPLRPQFEQPDRQRAIDKLKIDPEKKTILVTGASSGALNINNAMMKILPELERYASSWQIVHLTGRGKHSDVIKAYKNAAIPSKIIDYYDQMPDLLSAADIIVGRSGAVSVAEYAASGTASICIPYPYHKDRHQYLNAEKLSIPGAAVIVEDYPDDNQRTASQLLETLKELIANNGKRCKMAETAKELAKLDASKVIAREILELS